MKKSDIKNEIDQLRYERDCLSVKINNYKKSGKSIEDLLQKMNNIRSLISAKKTSKTEKIEKSEKNIKNSIKTPKIIKEPIKTSKIEKIIKEPTITYKKAEKGLLEWLDNNDYCEGYQFQHSNNFFIKDLNIYQDKKTKTIHLSFQLQFITKSRKVIKDIDWSVIYDDYLRLGKMLAALEKAILQQTSDPDRTDQVFGYERFQRTLFFEKGYDKIGWIIKK